VDQPGIDVRPLVRLDASDEFTEVFFTGARCPRANVVGPIDQGWRVANTALADERGTSSTTSWHRFARELDEIRAVAAERGRTRDAHVRQGLAASWSRVQFMRFTWLRSLTAALSDHPGAGTAALDSINKLYWSEYHRDVTNLAMDIMGPAAQVLTGLEPGSFIPGVGLGGAGEAYPAGPLQGSFLYARSETIWGGSSEIQRNIVAERVLGLPR
jgi:alkylation response protein AidB-like acyl-CoA dehydrogenase